MPGYLDLVRERVVIFDGATGTNLQLRELGPDDFGGPELEGCNEALVVYRPDVISDLHASFLDVGVDVIETDSFGSFPTVLAEYQIAGRAAELALRSAELAREVASGYSTPDHPRFVAGSIGPGTKFPTLGQIRFADLRDSYEVEARALLQGGVDLLLVETCFDLLGAKAALVACRRAMQAVGREVPLQVQVTIELTGRMLPGTEISAALAALEAMRPDVVGLNCATGPAEMYEPLRYLTGHARIPVSTMPNAGLPSVVDGRMHYDLSPDELADYLHSFVTELGVSVVGGCCGTTPAHLARVVEKVGGLVPRRIVPDHEPGVASLYSFVPFAQDQSVLVVGERTNANGSRRFREAMLAGDFETTTEMARDQVREGAHLIDVCVDYTGADGVRDMDEVISRLATQSTVPIMVDSTEPAVVRTALEWLGGRSVLNSVNLEDGDGPGTRLDAFLSLAREHGAAVVCTCIDEEGQARTAEWKLRAARAIHDLAVGRYGLEPSDLLFDPLALPLSTGMEESRRDGIETIEGIRRIKAELPGVHTILGLSNVSFGLSSAARQVLNSVFLHECVAAGLDAAIVHASRILPLHKVDEHAREVCLDLVYDRRRDGYDPLQELIALFEGVKDASLAKEDRSGWPIEERLSRRIVDGDRLGIEDVLDEALAAGNTALAIVNDVLLAGMKTVGELFASGEMQLPFVLQSAETMKAAVAHLEPHMDRAESSGRGRVVLATVKGDVHDIGKNLVDIILSNNGYDVVNIGIKQPLSAIVDAALEHGVDAIGMSGLLVKSTLVMRDNLAELNSRGLAVRWPVLLGGAALTRAYVEQDLATVFDGEVRYARDAFEGLRLMDAIMAVKRGEPGAGLPPARERRVRVGARLHLTEPSDMPARSDVAADNPVPEPPFWGERVISGIALADYAAYLDERATFMGQWGLKPARSGDGPDFGELVETQGRPRLRMWLARIASEGLVEAKVVYGYFPAVSEGNDLVVLDGSGQERERFTFPRQRHDRHLCLADFFRPRSSGERDVVAFQLVTVGRRLSEAAADLFAKDAYRDYLELHGLSVQLTEALAEYWHHRVREELGLASLDPPDLDGILKVGYQGCRYSFGYPACPDLEDRAKVMRLLRPERIGVSLSEEYQLTPEQSTDALITHHPEARYFSA